MSKPLIQHYLEMTSRLSLANQYRIGALLAYAVGFFPNQVSRQTRQNIELCFGELEPEAKNRLYRESIRHTCYALAELGAVWCWPPEKILAQVTETDICEEFGRAERGRIIIVPHLGSWETAVIWLGHNCDAIIMYKRRQNRAVDQFVLEARARSGGNPVPTKKRGLRKLLIGMKQGGNLMILPDQKPGRNKAHIESTFFGFNAPTTTLVQNLCTKFDCDVFIATMHRSDPVGEFRLRIRPLEHARLAAEETVSAQYMNDQIEALVRAHPEQYQWGYRRFDQMAYAAINEKGR